MKSPSSGLILEGGSFIAQCETAAPQDKVSEKALTERVRYEEKGKPIVRKSDNNELEISEFKNQNSRCWQDVLTFLIARHYHIHRHFHINMFSFFPIKSFR